MDLVIMAAGIGRRFGGLKQLQPIDDNNHFIIDYSICDAIRVGFDHVIFIIKEELFEDFKKTIGNRVEKYIKVDYVFQGNDVAVGNYAIPKDRVRPLGTGHAILCAKPYIKSDFAVINADDFYGREAYDVVADFLKTNKDEDRYALVGYEAINTLSPIGNIRGVCTIDGKNLVKITESFVKKHDDGRVTARPITNIEDEGKEISANRMVSMNLFAFTKKFLSYLQDYFDEFLEDNKNDLSTCEFFLPAVVTNLVQEKKSSVSVVPTKAKWYGVTYKEDLPGVKEAILQMSKDGVYKPNLWN